MNIFFMVFGVKRGVAKIFLWVGEKNTLLKKLTSALASAFFKSVTRPEVAKLGLQC